MQAEIRAPKKVWADENALDAIAGNLLRILILDEEGRDDGSKFVSRGFSATAEEERLPVILLTRTRRQHYNLVTWGGLAVLATSQKEIPAEISRIFLPDVVENPEKKRRTT